VILFVFVFITYRLHDRGLSSSVCRDRIEAFAAGLGFFMFIEPGPGWKESLREKAVKKRLLRRRVRGAFRMVPQPAYSAGGMPVMVFLE